MIGLGTYEEPFLLEGSSDGSITTVFSESHHGTYNQPALVFLFILDSPQKVKITGSITPYRDSRLRINTIYPGDVRFWSGFAKSLNLHSIDRGEPETFNDVLPSGAYLIIYTPYTGSVTSTDTGTVTWEFEKAPVSPTTYDAQAYVNPIGSVTVAAGETNPRPREGQGWPVWSNASTEVVVSARSGQVHVDAEVTEAQFPERFVITSVSYQGTGRLRLYRTEEGARLDAGRSFSTAYTANYGLLYDFNSVGDTVDLESPALGALAPDGGVVWVRFQGSGSAVVSWFEV